MLNRELISTYSPLPKNYNFDEVLLYEPIALEIWVKPILGELLLTELEEQMENNTISDENQALLTSGGLLQFIAYAITFQALPFIYARFTETGIVINDSDNSKSVDLKSLNYISDSVRRTLEVLKDKVKDYLCTRQDYYPLFNPCDCGCDSCCEDNDKLNSPNPLFQLYGLQRRDENIN